MLPPAAAAAAGPAAAAAAAARQAAAAPQAAAAAAAAPQAAAAAAAAAQVAAQAAQAAATAAQAVAPPQAVAVAAAAAPQAPAAPAEQLIDGPKARARRKAAHQAAAAAQGLPPAAQLPPPPPAAAAAQPPRKHPNRPRKQRWGTALKLWQRGNPKAVRNAEKREHESRPDVIEEKAKKRDEKEAAILRTQRASGAPRPQPRAPAGLTAGQKKGLADEHRRHFRPGDMERVVSEHGQPPHALQVRACRLVRVHRRRHRGRAQQPQF